MGLLLGSGSRGIEVQRATMASFRDHLGAARYDVLRCGQGKVRGRNSGCHDSQATCRMAGSLCVCACCPVANRCPLQCSSPMRAAHARPAAPTAVWARLQVQHGAISSRAASARVGTCPIEKHGRSFIQSITTAWFAEYSGPPKFHNRLPHQPAQATVGLRETRGFALTQASTHACRTVQFLSKPACHSAGAIKAGRFTLFTTDASAAADLHASHNAIAQRPAQA